MAVAVDNTALFRARATILNKKTEESFRDKEKVLPLDGPQKDLRTTATSSFSLYCSHAHQILTDITELRDLVLDKRKEYILCSNAFSLYGVQKFMSDEDRRKFDQETDLAFRHCTKLIKSLEAQIESDRTLRPADQLKHLLAVTNLLNVYLKEVLSIVTQLRAIHVRKSRQIRRICRLANLVEMYGARIEQSQKEEEEKALKLVRMLEELKENEKIQWRKEETREEDKENVMLKKGRRKTAVVDGWEEAQIEEEELIERKVPSDGWEEAQFDDEQMHLKTNEQRSNSVDGWEETQIWTEEANEERFKSEDNFEEAQTKEEIVVKAKERLKSLDVWENVKSEEREQSKAEQSQLLEENRKLFERFTTTDAELSRIETQMSEIQRLQGIFAEKISEQEQEIDVIHSRTVYTLDNLETANEFIREAIKNQANRRVILIFCLLVLTFTLIFLDWYNP
ncbi:hypothetical protein niasHT_023275 [Heterodera trifolii]|uniref:Syntaxin-18 n=1 Tax=Heterodera trifolii TaxID=157864 RepID=A0ABD2JDR2_9BILA